MGKTVWVAAVLVALVVAPGRSAAAPTTWREVTTGVQRGQVGVLRLGKNLLISWTRLRNNKVDLMTTLIRPDGSIAWTAPIFAGWTSMGDSDLVPTKTGGVRAFWDGVRGLPNPKLDGINTAVAPAAGSPWKLGPTSIVNEGVIKMPGAGIAKDFSPLQTWSVNGGSIAVHKDFDPDAAASQYDKRPGCCSTSPDLVTDKTGSMTVAWCNSGTKPNGIHIQGIDPATGKPAGPRQLLAGSAVGFEGKPRRNCDGQRVAVAARAGGGTFFAATSGYPIDSRVLVWRMGTKQPMVVATNANSERFATLSADHQGHIWVAWYDGGAKLVKVRRTNAHGTAFGPTIVLAPPANTASIYNVAISATASGADVLITRLGFDNNAGVWLTHVKA